MTTNSMTYNGLDTRVGMTDSTGSRTFRRAGIGVTSPVLSDGSASFTPSGENRAGVKTAYHGGLKSFDTQTNAAQSIVGQRLTDAFGNQISSSGVWKGRFAYGGPYGYQEDPDTGLRLLGHRYYDSSTGRFLTRDPIKDGRNWYVYCDNSPVLGVDPTGLVKIFAYFRVVAAGGVHWFLVIVDNVVGSPTYGQRWVVSGHPENTSFFFPGKLVGTVGREGDKEDPPHAKDKARPGEDDVDGGVVLVDDQSPVGPWLSGANIAVSELSGKHGYGFANVNSNTMIYYVLSRLGLLDELGKAMGKRGSFPFSPGWKFPPPYYKDITYDPSVPAGYPGHPEYPGNSRTREIDFPRSTVFDK